MYEYFNILLRLLLEKCNDIKFSAYADDLSVLVDANIVRSLEIKLCKVWTIVDDWCCKMEKRLRSNFLVIYNKTE